MTGVTDEERWGVAAWLDYLAGDCADDGGELLAARFTADGPRFELVRVAQWLGEVGLERHGGGIRMWMRVPEVLDDAAELGDPVAAIRRQGEREREKMPFPRIGDPPTAATLGREEFDRIERDWRREMAGVFLRVREERARYVEGMERLASAFRALGGSDVLYSVADDPEEPLWITATFSPS